MDLPPHLVSVQKAVKDLIGASNSVPPRIDLEAPQVNSFVVALERILTDKLKSGGHDYWQFAQTTNVIARPLADAVESVTTNVPPRYNRGRAWLKECLFRQCLVGCFKYVASHPEMTRTLYAPDSVMYSETTLSIIVSIILPIQSVVFTQDPDPAPPATPPTPPPPPAAAATGSGLTSMFTKKFTAAAATLVSSVVSAPITPRSPTPSSNLGGSGANQNSPRGGATPTPPLPPVSSTPPPPPPPTVDQPISRSTPPPPPPFSTSQPATTVAVAQPTATEPAIADGSHDDLVVISRKKPPKKPTSKKPVPIAAPPEPTAQTQAQPLSKPLGYNSDYDQVVSSDSISPPTPTLTMEPIPSQSPRFTPPPPMALDPAVPSSFTLGPVPSRTQRSSSDAEQIPNEPPQPMRSSSSAALPLQQGLGNGESRSVEHGGGGGDLSRIATHSAFSNRAQEDFMAIAERRIEAVTMLRATEEDEAALQSKPTSLQTTATGGSENDAHETLRTEMGNSSNLQSVESVEEDNDQQHAVLGQDGGEAVGEAEFGSESVGLRVGGELEEVVDFTAAQDLASSSPYPPSNDDTVVPPLSRPSDLPPHHEDDQPIYISDAEDEVPPHSSQQSHYASAVMSHSSDSDLNVAEPSTNSLPPTSELISQSDTALGVVDDEVEVEESGEEQVVALEFGDGNGNESENETEQSPENQQEAVLSEPSQSPEPPMTDNNDDATNSAQTLSTAATTIELSAEDKYSQAVITTTDFPTSDQQPEIENNPPTNESERETEQSEEAIEPTTAPDSLSQQSLVPPEQDSGSDVVVPTTISDSEIQISECGEESPCDRLTPARETEPPKADKDEIDLTEQDDRSAISQSVEHTEVDANSKGQIEGISDLLSDEGRPSSAVGLEPPAVGSQGVDEAMLTRVISNVLKSESARTDARFSRLESTLDSLTLSLSSLHSKLDHLNSRPPALAPSPTLQRPTSEPFSSPTTENLVALTSKFSELENVLKSERDRVERKLDSIEREMKRLSDITMMAAQHDGLSRKQPTSKSSLSLSLSSTDSLTPVQTNGKSSRQTSPSTSTPAPISRHDSVLAPPSSSLTQSSPKSLGGRSDSNSRSNVAELEPKPTDYYVVKSTGLSLDDQLTPALETTHISHAARGHEYESRAHGLSLAPPSLPSSVSKKQTSPTTRSQSFNVPRSAPSSEEAPVSKDFSAPQSSPKDNFSRSMAEPRAATPVVSPPTPGSETKADTSSPPSTQTSTLQQNPKKTGTTDQQQPSTPKLISAVRTESPLVKSSSSSLIQNLPSTVTSVAGSAVSLVSHALGYGGGEKQQQSAADGKPQPVPIPTPNLGIVDSDYSSEISIEQGVYSGGPGDEDLQVIDQSLTKPPQIPAVSSGHHMKLLVDPPPQRSARDQLTLQNYQCAACAQPIGTLWSRARHCTYTGKYFCYLCHLKEKAYIPAKILYSWDFYTYPVSALAKAYLDGIVDLPMICISAVNPSLFTTVPSLARARLLRVELSFCKDIIAQCPGSKDALLGVLSHRGYLLADTENYTVSDLLDLSGTAKRNPSLISELENCLKLFKRHVMFDCRPCSERAKRQCPACNHKGALFAFDTQTTCCCPKCGNVFHRACFLNGRCSVCDGTSKQHSSSHLDELM